MVDFEKKAENDVLELREQLTDMSTDMRMFSLSMRSLYVENSVGTNTPPAKRFRKLREDTKNDAMVYLKGVLPLSKKFVASISEYFDFYDALDFKQWREMFSDILDKTVTFRELCETLVKMHEDILVPLKQRKDEAVVVAKELKDLAEFEKKKKELEAKATTKRSWAVALSSIPVIGAIAGPVLETAADSDLAEAVAEGSQGKIQEAAAIVVSESLIPALEAFIDGIRKAAGFFSVMEQELRGFQGKAEEGQSNANYMYLYYKVMNKEAVNMKSTCQVFFTVLPDVRTDLLAIPSGGIDQNYIDSWLEKQKKTIKDNFKGGLLANKLLELIESKDGE